MIAQIVTAEHLGGHRLCVGFSDGVVGVWDHSDILQSTGPIASPLHDPAFFGRVAIVDGALVWPNGYDACPVTLHRVVAGALEAVGD
jgi:hypothetical protein